MKVLTELSFSWVDLTVVILLGVGLTRGRKRGMSGELLDLIKWLLIVVGGAFLYQPLNHYLSQAVPGLSDLAGYLIAYIGFGSLIILIFGSIKHRLGGRLSQGDVFGSGEYYLGMLAGITRWTCMIIASLALIHARQYSRVEVQAREKAQEDNFGSIRFFRLYSLQSDIFKYSMVGQTVENCLPALLIKSTSAAAGAPVQPKPRARDRRLNEVLDR